MRKKPQQARSRQMVDTLIEATARVISQRGLDGTTTPAIAEVAGVSVGSLYQYFDGKDALITALLDKLVGDLARVLDIQAEASAAMSLREMVQAAIALTVAFMRSNEGLYLELARNWHRLPVDHVADTLQAFIVERSRLYFLQHQLEYPIRDLPVRLFIAYNSTLFTLMRLMSQEDSHVSQEAVVESLVDMITHLLEKGVAPPLPTHPVIP
ncbi:MAG TPA: TetR/AcrR family transcriptional regulator [Moraxellaceae bacterium]|nr:TetR/AcrR family transcriptional regulator [Moraxellaceae bacterium]